MMNQFSPREFDLARGRRIGLFGLLLALGAAMLSLGAVAQNAASGSGEGVILTLNGAVTPASASYLEREIQAADVADADLIIIEIDTPGGLVDSMKTIIKSILASETPVATFVSPQGARSASAGLYIMYSAHISAMAPATNTGAATPVEVGGGSPPPEESPFDGEEPVKKDDAESENAEETVASDDETSSGDAPADAADAVDEGEAVEAPAETARPDATDDANETAPLSNDSALRAKIINDSVAYIRSLADERGRNADWAERAVREAVSVTSREALELNVIDLIADDIDDLLQKIDGRVVETAAGEVTLKTQNLKLTRVEPTTVEKILGFISNPNVAVILMSLATTGIIIEMWNPGSIFPGALGLTCLVLGLYSFQVLPYNVLPLVLMGIGAILMVIEAYSPTFGLAGLSGLVLFGVGMYFLFPDGFRVSGSVIGTIMAISGGLLALILFALIGSRSHGPMLGGDAIKKREGVVDDWDGKEGWVIVEGERWRARADKPLTPGDKIRVVEVDGLVLVVKQMKAGGLLGGLAPGEARA